MGGPSEIFRFDLLAGHAAAIAAKGWRAVMRLNVKGTMTMTEAAAQAAWLGGRGAGTVVNVTVSPHHGMPAMAHTGAARAAVEALTAELADRWRDDGVTVVAAAIGRFDTESLRKYPEIVWRQAARSVPLQRLGAWRSSPGSWRCSPRRSAGRSARRP
jgi:citronellol/citronellal dehydrogenase